MSFVYVESVQQIVGMADSFPWLFGVYAGMIFWGVNQASQKIRHYSNFSWMFVRIEGEVGVV